jgi:hypothetical protein
MNKALFQYCQKHLRDLDSGQLKVSASLKRLHNSYHVGEIDNGWFYFTDKDKQHLIHLVALELNGTHLFRDNYPSPQSRTQIAKQSRSEKVGALKVSHDFILINSLGPLRINQKITSMPAVSALGYYLCASEIETIEHEQIVLVENLIVMANLKQLNIPEQLKGALWLYRGDSQAQQQTGTAYSFFRRFTSSHQLISFSDLDPSGLQISLTSGATHWLTIANAEALDIKLAGPENEWFKQHNAINYIEHYSKEVGKLAPHCATLFKRMGEVQTTLKQEHMIAHSVKLTLHAL